MKELLNVAMCAAGPPATIFMGLGIGTRAPRPPSLRAGCGQCVADDASWSDCAVPRHNWPGSYCVSIFDVGNQTAHISYTVTVSHR